MRHVSRFVTVSAALSLAVFGWASTGSQAVADQKGGEAPSHVDADRHSKGVLLAAPLAASLPTDPAIFGVSPGGAPWRISRGNVRLDRDGFLEADVDGLVLTSSGSNPIPDLAASVYCNGAAAATTAPVPFSTRGNADIRATVTLPAFCPVPAVLLKPATGTSPSTVINRYIGFDGQG
jgi:hypothetical protein